MSHELRNDFSLNATQFSYIGASFYIAYAFMQVPSGWLVDRFGVRRIFTFSAILTGSALIVFATTENFFICLLARALMGCGVSSAFIGNYYLAARLLQHRYFSLVAAILHLLASLGAFLAQGPLALMVNYFGWRQPIFFVGLMLFIMACMFGTFIRNGESQTQSKNALLKSITFSTSFKYIISHSQIKWIALCGFMGWLPFSVLGGFWGIPYLMQVYNISSITASGIFSYFWIGSACGGLVLSFLSEFFSLRKKVILFCFYGEILSALILINSASLPQWCISFTLLFLGVFVCMQTLSFTLIKENVEPKFFALSAAANNIGAMLSSAIGQNLFGWLIDLQAGTELVYKVIYFRNAMFMFLVAAICGAFICKFKVRETYCRLSF